MCRHVMHEYGSTVCCIRIKNFLDWLHLVFEMSVEFPRWSGRLSDRYDAFSASLKLHPQDVKTTNV